MSASMNCKPCCCAIGLPNATRPLSIPVAYSSAPVGDAERLRGDAGARLVEHLHRDLEAFALVAEQFAAGTRQSVNTSSTVGDPRMPIFFSSLPTANPGVPFSTTKR